jgi:nicotinamidase-related amidase
MIDPSERLPRSTELMSPDDSALLVVDVQDKLIKLIPDYRAIVWNIRRLLDGASILDVLRVATEQYPKGLGPTTSELAERLNAAGGIPDKSTFSCGGCTQLVATLRSKKISKLLVCGIEAHVCVQQTVLDFLADGYRVYVAADAIGSRGTRDFEIALRRMESSGATLTTTEAALFEWCQSSDKPAFKQISALVRESCPTE